MPQLALLSRSTSTVQQQSRQQCGMALCLPWPLELAPPSLIFPLFSAQVWMAPNYVRAVCKVAVAECAIFKCFRREVRRREGPPSR